MAAAGHQGGGGQASWREGKSVESVWGPDSFGVQDSGGSRGNNSHYKGVGYSQTNTGGSWVGSSSGRSTSSSCESGQDALLKSVQK